jgi:Uncharacterised protein family (UPF0193)
MQHRGCLPDYSHVSSSRKMTEAEELERLFDAVQLEIDERRQFLGQMDKGSISLVHFQTIKHEIDERIDELHALDSMIKAS